MSQCVPTWEIDENTTTRRHSLRSASASAAAADIPVSVEYEVAELTWENGQVALHGLGGRRTSPASKYGSGGGTLESIVNQATRMTTMDALVPEQSGPTRVGSCSGTRRDGTISMDSNYEMDTQEMCFGFTTTTSTSFDTTTLDDHLSVSHSLPLPPPQRDVADDDDKKKLAPKSSVSTKRSRAAAIHNQSERKRRDKINQRMKTLQKLVPNSSKTDKASMLDEVIEYLKQLQAQVSMMSRMNMPSMMLPMAAMQMSMMSNPMGMGMGMHGMGMGMGHHHHVMDIHSMNHRAAAPNIIPNPFMPMPPHNDSRYQQPPPPPDPISAFLSSSQSQPMTMDAYSRMAAFYQQMQQQLPPPSNSK